MSKGTQGTGWGVHSPGPTLESDSVGLAWDPEICIFSTRCPRDSAVVVPEPNFNKYQFQQGHCRLTSGQNSNSKLAVINPGSSSKSPGQHFSTCSRLHLRSNRHHWAVWGTRPRLLRHCHDDAVCQAFPHSAASNKTHSFLTHRSVGGPELSGSKLPQQRKRSRRLVALRSASHAFPSPEATGHPGCVLLVTDHWHAQDRPP